MEDEFFWNLVPTLVAISIGLISMSPDDVIEPRMENVPVACYRVWNPMCGVMVTLNLSGVVRL